ncbi:MAG: M14 family metallocarboxypeptidase [Clostridia bacterium]|nr:M14 family metallocarboxypeptidase [Clostridia bacterium]
MALSPVFDPTHPLGYPELCAATRQLGKSSRHFQSFSAGKSVLGRRLFVYVIGSGRPYALYCGTHHALEYMTSMLLVEFTHRLCAHCESGEPLAGIDVRGILKNRSVCIVPMLNPDGVELHLGGLKTAGALADGLSGMTADFSGWQANARGVDLNHNYNAGWNIVHAMEIESGITGPAPRRYGGPHAESEPETHALCNLCRKIPFSRVYALHSQGEEIYWQYGERTPKNAEAIAARLAAASGYALAQPEPIASHGGFKDWFIQVFARPAFTVEVGFGCNPLPLTDFPLIYEKIEPMLALGLTL